MEGNRPVLGLDLDGVCFAFDIGATIALNMEFGLMLQARESEHWNELEERVTPKQWQWVWNRGVRQVFECAPEYPGVLDAVRRMQDYTDIVVMTHRPRAVADITLTRLGHAGIRPTAVHHCQHRDKSGIAKCDAYVDDRPENVMELAGVHGVPVFIPRKPWNAEFRQTLCPPYPAHELDIRPYDTFKDVEAWAKEAAGKRRHIR